jgi:hypothetical protein
MNIDAYTRIVLTIVAVCLVYFVAKDLTLLPEAHAQDVSAPMAVNIVQIAGSPVAAPSARNFQASLPVRVLD